MVEDLADDLMKEKIMIRRTRMRLEVVVGIRGETIQMISMIKTKEIREEEVEGKDLEEETSMGNVFTMEKKGTKNLNSPNDKEGLLE